MNEDNISVLKTFGEDAMPDLDTAVLGALELFTKSPVSWKKYDEYRMPLVVGSGNALSVGRILFGDTNAVFASESTYADKLGAISEIDGLVLVSASGGKHAVRIALDCKQKGIPYTLLTNNSQAPAAKYIDNEHVYVFPKNREPYTYNTSTYMGMIMSKTGENAKEIYTHIENNVRPAMPSDFGAHDAFFFVLPGMFEDVGSMMLAKFDELFGARVSARVFTAETAKHAKTVVPYEREYFIALGDAAVPPYVDGKQLAVPLSANAGAGEVMAVAYYVIGAIQKQHPPYFKEYIKEYATAASGVFGEKIEPIVE